MNRASIVTLAVRAVATLAILFTYGCGPASNPKHPSSPDPDIDAPADQKLVVCTKASDRLEALHCKEARKDFPKFCVDMLNDNIPIKPSCLSQINSCDDINAKCK